MYRKIKSILWKKAPTARLMNSNDPLNDTDTILNINTYYCNIIYMATTDIKIFCVTLGSDIPRCKDLLDSALLYGNNIEVIDSTKTYRGYISKIEDVETMLNEPSCIIRDDDVVCFVDAYDVIFSGTEHEILSKFQATGLELLFSTELNMTGYPENHPHFKSVYEFIHKNLSTNFRYINTGGYIGTKRAILKWHSWCSKHEREKIVHQLYDGGYAMTYYMNQLIGELWKPINVGIDYQCNIFQSMYLINWKEFYFMNKRIYNKTLDNNTPCIIHFNGSSFQYLDGCNNDSSVIPIFLENLYTSDIIRDTKIELKVAPSGYKHHGYPRLQK